jgi:biofilm PGA synthesis N-glycosyltransferase PgaC
MIDWSAIPIVARQVLETLMSDPAFVYLFAPAILLIELPITIAVLVGILVWRRRYEQHGPVTILPKVSVIATTYSEGAAVRSTIVSLLEQTYLGQIEIVVVVDGAAQNRATYDAAMACLSLDGGACEPVAGRFAKMAARRPGLVDQCRHRHGHGRDCDPR